MVPADDARGEPPTGRPRPIAIAPGGAGGPGKEPARPGRIHPARVAEHDRLVPVGAEEEWAALDFHAGATLLRIDLDGLRFDLLGEDPAVAAAARDLWHDFEAAPGAAPPDVTVSLRGTDRLPFDTPTGSAARAEREGRLLAKVRGVALVVEVGARRASVLVERPLARMALANAVRVLLWIYAPPRERLLLHATAVEAAGGAVLFFGPSHAGKSTVARLSVPRPVLTDDAVLLHPQAQGLRAATVGFWGSEGSEGLARVRARERRPVRALVGLERGEANRIAPVSRARAVTALLGATSLVLKDPAHVRAVLGLAGRAAAAAPAFHLTFHNRDGSFWSLLEDLG